jgi:hypothetical protein
MFLDNSQETNNLIRFWKEIFQQGFIFVKAPEENKVDQIVLS